MALDVLLLGVLAAYAGLGAWRGPVESALRLGAWVAGYAAAWLVAGALGPAVAAALGVAPLLGAPLAGAAAFLLVQAAAHLAILRARRDAEPAELPGRAAGALLGAARGAVVVVLLGWLASLGEGLREQGIAGIPSLGDSALSRASGRVVERGAELSLGSGRPEARAVAALVARPAETVAAWRGVLAHPRFVALQQDAAFWAAVEAGALDAARARPSFRGLVADATLRDDLGRLGLVTPGAAAHPIAFERELSRALAEAATRVATLRDDPEVQALLADPEVLGLLERGDALRLLAHPGFQTLLRRAGAS